MVSWAFCDFGLNFEVLDSTGEEPKEFFVWKITKVHKQHNFDDKNKNNFIVTSYKSNNLMLSCKMCFDRQIMVW